MNGDKKKQIELPITVLTSLEKMAKTERMLVKPYMEKVLIEHVKGKK
jgi:hypothetical protein